MESGCFKKMVLLNTGHVSKKNWLTLTIINSNKRLTFKCHYLSYFIHAKLINLKLFFLSK